MEIWKEVFKGIIPKDNYCTLLSNSDENGLIIELKGKSNKITMTFGAVEAIRMLDEGIVQAELYSDDEIKKYKKNKFENVIYEAEEGEFKQKMKKVSLGFIDNDVKHYILITENYNIDIITYWEPEIDVINLN